MKLAALTVPVLLVAAAACSQAQQRPARPTTVRVPEAWARVQGDITGMSAGYFTIQNTGTTAVVVRSVSCTGIRMVTVHETRVENSMARMAPRDSLVAPAGQQVVMRPGGIHLMLMGLERPLNVGDTLRCTLRTSAGDVPVEAAVRAS